MLEEFLPSGLVPNAERVLDMFKHYPTTIGFQASATPGIVYDKERAPYMTDWTDLADERLKGKLTMPIPGDITCGGMLLGIAAALGLDYKKPDEMTQAIDFADREDPPERVAVHHRQCDDAAAAARWRGRRGRILEQPGPLGVPERSAEHGLPGRQVRAIPGQRVHVDHEGQLPTRSWPRSSSTGG